MKLDCTLQGVGTCLQHLQVVNLMEQILVKLNVFQLVAVSDPVLTR
jgi:hypothetical protein